MSNLISRKRAALNGIYLLQRQVTGDGGFRQPEQERPLWRARRGQDVHPAQEAVKGGPSEDADGVDITPASKGEMRQEGSAHPGGGAGLPGASDQHDHLSPKAMGGKPRRARPSGRPAQVSSWRPPRRSRVPGSCPRLSRLQLACWDWRRLSQEVEAPQAAGSSQGPEYG